MSERNETSVRVTCPDNTNGSDLRGCGATFDATPDDEGLIDCHECGIWFPVAHGTAALTTVEPTRGDQVVYFDQDGRRWLGDVVDTAGSALIVRHFNGEMWPFQPLAASVQVLRP